MKFGSVCSGIEAASMAFNPLGWKAQWFSEIEPFPCSVLKHHYPDTPNLGDMTKFNEWPTDDQHAIDLLCGGTPCQSFSVAGLRKGLDDPRGNLMLTFGAIAAKYRPQWLVWENVPGVLSSNGGRDFGSFLGMLGQLGYGFAYRVFDAQYFGVAQRRRRVFVVGCLGDWHSAAAVLFERHSLQGHPAPSRKAGQTVTPTIRAGAANGGPGHGARSGDSKDELIVPVAYRTAGDGAVYEEGCITAPLTTSTDPSANILAFDTTQCTSAANRSNPKAGDPCHPLAAGAHAPAIALGVSIRGRDGGGTAELGDEVGNCLRASGGGGDKAHVLTALQVRRLTPKECARLQGFPDTYLDINHRGKPAADGPKYKAIGNSWAVPNVAWIGRRIDQVQVIRVNSKLSEAA